MMPARSFQRDRLKGFDYRVLAPGEHDLCDIVGRGPYELRTARQLRPARRFSDQTRERLLRQSPSLRRIKILERGFRSLPGRKRARAETESFPLSQHLVRFA